MPVANISIPGRQRAESNEQGSSRPEQLLLAFTNAIATVRDRTGLKTVIKCFFREHFAIHEYIITVRNEDPETFSYFLHDLPAKAPIDEGFKVITSNAMPVKGSMTGVVLRSDNPSVTSRLSEVATVHKLSFPSESFWRAAGAQDIVGIRLRLATEDVGILW